MAHLLNLHTTTEIAIVNLVVNGQLIDSRENHHPREHAGFLHSAMEDLLKKQQVTLKDLTAIGVSNGPGSYTGIRIGLASAGGLCFALKIPMITFNSLDLLALGAIEQDPDFFGMYVPMIDARRMEVYTSMVDAALREIQGPSAMILDADSFSEVLHSGKVRFFGSGSEKFRKICNHPNASFAQVEISSSGLARWSWKKFLEGSFENHPYAMPLYIKDFHTIPTTGI